MKKILIWTIALALALTAAAFADKNNSDSALDAFNKLTQQSTSPSTAAASNKTSSEYLTEVMAGMYLTDVTTQNAAANLAPALNGLSSVTSLDIALYAGENNIAMEKVRNAYFQSLANVLRAEIMVNPASEEQYRNIQLILSLFLYNDDQPTSDVARDAIRDSMTKEHAQTIATDYNLPLSFVEFMIMDDDWDDTDYMNDSDWTASTNYAWSYGDTPDLTPDNTPDNTPKTTKTTTSSQTSTTTKKYTNATTPTAKPKTTTTTKTNSTRDNTPDNTKNTPDYTKNNTPDNTRNTPDNTKNNTPDNTRNNTPDNT